MFKLKESSLSQEGIKMAELVKSELEKLKEEVSVIRHLEVGINVVSLPHAFDIVLTTDFDTLEDLQVYKVHPAHLAFIEFNKNYSVSKTSVDYLY